MGGHCMKPNAKQKSLLEIENRKESLALINEKQILKLAIKISNLSLSYSQELCKVVFRVQNKFEAIFSESDIVLSQKMVKWNANREVELKLGRRELEFGELSIQIINKKNKLIQKLQIKLHLLCSGPKHHDHLLKQMKSRMIFDIQISQLIEVKASCSKFSHTTQQNKHIKIAYSLTIIPKEERECLSIINPQEEQQIHRSIPLNKLKQSSLNITIYDQSFQNNLLLPQNIHEIYFPFVKIFQSDQAKIITQEESGFQKRKIAYESTIENNISISIQIQVWLSQIYIEQMQCLVYSEQGIKIRGHSHIQKLLFLQEQVIQPWLQDFTKKLKKLKYLSYENKQEVQSIIKKGFDFLTKNDNCDTETQINKIQLLLIDVLSLLASFFTSGEDVINQHIWILIDKILHRPELSISLISTTQIKDRKVLGINLYNFICIVLQKVIESVNVGLTYHQLKCVQKFISYVYFRLPWIRQKIVTALRKQDDPVLTEEKLIQIGAFYGNKSPSKTLAYDWQYCLFSHIKNQIKYKEIISNLQQVEKDVPQWAQVLFNRNDDELYYSLLIQIWNQAEFFLNNQGKIMWEYFPFYGELLGTFLGQMNKNQIIEYSKQFHQCSVKLISNEKLLNSFMLQLFPKTCLYETYCVIKSLQLINSYFQVLKEKRRQIPSDFNYLYFYTGIKEIFQSNHSFLLLKILSLLYRHYYLFSGEFQKQIQNYILYHIFFKMFLHWCNYVRKIFYHLLQFRVTKKFRLSKSEVSLDLLQNKHHFDELINLVHEVIRQQKYEKNGINERNTNEYFLRMKRKLERKKRNLKVQREKQLQFQMNNGLISTKIPQTQIKELSFTKNQRKWSTNDNSMEIQNIPEHLKKYCILAMEEYQVIKSVENPDEKVEALLKIFNGGKDVKA